MSDDCVIPESILSNDEAFALYVETIADCREAYLKLVEMGIAREDARFIVPNAHKTTILVNWNVRSLTHILDLRWKKPGAQWEIREMMSKIIEIVKDESNVLFETHKMDNR